MIMKTKMRASSTPAVMATALVEEFVDDRRRDREALEMAEDAAVTAVQQAEFERDLKEKEFRDCEAERLRRAWQEAAAKVEMIRVNCERQIEVIRAKLCRLSVHDQAVVDQGIGELKRRVRAIETDPKNGPHDRAFMRWAAEKIPAYHRASRTIQESARLQVDPAAFVHETLRAVGLTVEVLPEV
jgi:hypothetical protein